MSRKILPSRRRASSSNSRDSSDVQRKCRFAFRSVLLLYVSSHFASNSLFAQGAAVRGIQVYFRRRTDSLTRIMGYLSLGDIALCTAGNPYFAIKLFMKSGLNRRHTLSFQPARLALTRLARLA